MALSVTGSGHYVATLASLARRRAAARPSGLGPVAHSPPNTRLMNVGALPTAIPTTALRSPTWAAVYG
jgi:hypothetical protein